MTLILLILLEAILVLVVFAALLFVKNRSLRRRLDAVSDSADTAVIREASAGAWLAEQIQRTEWRIEGPEGQDQLIPLKLRQQFLNAERQAVSMSGEDENLFWRVLTEALSAIQPRKASEPADDQGLEVLDGLVEEGPAEDESVRLRERNQVLQERIDNLEKFKDMFFDMKEKIDRQEGLIEQLHAELKQAVADGADLTMLQATVDQLAYEKSDLQDQVADMAKRLSDKPSRPEPNKPVEVDIPVEADKTPATVKESTASRIDTVSQSGQHMSDEVENMREVVTCQESKIQEMSQLIGELRLEVSDKDRLKQIVTQLEGRSIDLDKAMGSLEKENNFLQDQISALLSQEVTKDEQFTEELQRVQERLASKESAYSELEKKYAALEGQYLDAVGSLGKPQAC